MSLSQLEWDMVFSTLSEEQRLRVFDLAFRLMPSEPPEPEDLEFLAKRQTNGDSFSFSSAKEIAAYFGIPE
jgi:hypothetical protein